MRTKWRLLPLLMLMVVGIGASVFGGVAMNAGATTSKVVPTCKKGQKTTKAHPCKKPVVKKTTTTTTKTTTTPKSSSGSTSTTPSGSGSSAGAGAGAGGGAGTGPDGCPAGQTIPTVGGDDDTDNTAGGASDGDGCI